MGATTTAAQTKDLAPQHSHVPKLMQEMCFAIY
jgi:hypothetical protein